MPLKAASSEINRYLSFLFGAANQNQIDQSFSTLLFEQTTWSTCVVNFKTTEMFNLSQAAACRKGTFRFNNFRP